MGKRYIIALTQLPVNLSVYPEATVEDSISAPPPPLSEVVLPRFVQHVREIYPEFEVISGCSKKDFENKEEFMKMAEIVFIVDAPGSLLGEVMTMAPNIKWVHSYLAGIDGICKELLYYTKPSSDPSLEKRRESELLVTNARGVFSSSLKEYTMAAIFHFSKQIPRLQKNKQEKKWERFIMGELKGKTVGFVGYGDIAKEIAAACKVFGMNCIALRRDTSKQCELLSAVYGSKGEDALEVYRQSDFIVCTLPATPETINSISHAQFNSMKRTAVFISIGRGCVVDEDALLQALKTNQISGAALDVFNREPLPSSSPLWEAPNLLLSPHNSDFNNNYSISSSLSVFDRNMILYLRGVNTNKHMYTPVDCSRGY